MVSAIIQENFLESEHEYDWGKFEDRQLSIDERLKMITLYKTASDFGVVFPFMKDDLNTIREACSMPPIDDQNNIDDLYQSYLDSKTGNSEPDNSKNDGLKRETLDSTETPYNHWGK